MILLMGEQPAANLLPVRRHKPDTAVVVHTAWTERQAGRLTKALPNTNVLPVTVEPYRIDDIAAKIREQVAAKKWSASKLLFNLTGGTKPMSLAAYDIAQELNAPFLYFQTEGGVSRIYRYSFNAGGHARLDDIDDVPESITLRDYLELYLDDYEATTSRHPFEQAVGDVLATGGLEVMHSVYPLRQGALEIDLVVRSGNRIAILEAKLKAGKRAIDQLVAAGSQRYLGTYVSRYVVSTQPLDRNNHNLAEAHRVTAIVLQSFATQNGTLSDEDKQSLLTALRG